MSPYSIACSTCGARLKVRDPKAIGELSLCPKCGSMVMITPPTPGAADLGIGLRGPSDSSPQLIVRRPPGTASDFEDAAALLADTVDDLSRSPPSQASGTGVSPVMASKPPAAKPTANKQSKFPAALTGETPVPLALEPRPPAPPPIAAPTESMSSIELDPRLAAGEQSTPLAHAAVPRSQSFDLQPSPAPQHNHAAQPLASLAGAPPPVVDDRPWESPAQQLLRRYALIGGAVVAAVIVVGVLLSIVFRQPAQPAVAATGESESAANHSPPPKDENRPAPIPDETPAHVAPPADDEPTAENPTAETGDDESPPTAAATDEPPAAGDAPPLFAEGDDSPPADLADDESPGEAVADAGLGDFAPLIDAFPIPETPARDPADGEAPPAPADEAPAPTKRERPEPLAVDVAARLADPIDGIDTGGAPLVKFLELMSQLSTIPITLPPESLAEAQCTATSPVSLVLRDANVEKILEAGLAEHGLKFEVRGEQIVVVAAPKRGSGPIAVSLTVEDLAPDATAIESLAAHVRTFVAPGAKIVASSGKLEVTAPQDVQFDVHVFCQKLRVARGLAPRSKLDPSLFALASRSQRSAAKLAVPIRAIFHAERPLTQILDHLEKTAEVTLLVDWEALIAAGWPPHTTTTIIVDGQSLSIALDELLAPMDLAWRAIDENTVQITSREALENRPELEFYSIAAQIDGGADPEKLIDDLKAKLGAEHFADAGTGGTGEIAYDAASKCVLVRLPQVLQQKVAAQLAPAAE